MKILGAVRKNLGAHEYAVLSWVLQATWLLLGNSLEDVSVYAHKCNTLLTPCTFHVLLSIATRHDTHTWLNIHELLDIFPDC